MPIEILPSDVVDQIAAGEVVERPAHLVKELVENSLDAGATEIEIDFARGGREVRVTDNGSGIAATDLPLAVARHATSKIKRSSDLWTLGSYGFRGEALATIAAVSEFEVTSRQGQAQKASSLQVHFGVIDDLTEGGGLKGTSVLVRELFGNVPARLKFLKSETAEGTSIKQVLKALALANCQVQFRVKNAGELVFHWPKTETLRERAEQILGVEPLFESESDENGWRVRVALADPKRVERTSRQIWIFVQGRFVQDRGLQAAVIESYRNLLMHGEFPVAVVQVQAPPEEVDINIHPTKSMVKFQNSSQAFRRVLFTCRELLERAPWRNEVLPEHTGFEAPIKFGPQLESRVEEQFSFSSPAPLQTLQTYAPPRPEPMAVQEVRPGHLAAAARPIPALTKWSDLKVLGQAHLTYILAESEEAFVLIDQHAAHERVAFERLWRAWKGEPIAVQQFLLPLTLNLPPLEVETLSQNAAELERIGIHLETSGPGSIAVVAAPVLLQEKALVLSLERWAQEARDWGGSLAIDKKVSDILASMACHSVVRAGQMLGMEQMQELLLQMDEFPLSDFCPHGRPVMVELPWSRLERDFGRLI